MVDIVESLVLQELSGRISQRRNNARANQSLLRNPRKLNSVITSLGTELLTESQLENINQDVFRRDSVQALDSSFDEADPRRGSLVKIRNTVKKFISDPRNQHIAPEKIFATAFNSEQTRATPELSRLFKENNENIKFPGAITSLSAAETLSEDPGSFVDVAVAALKGAVQAPVDNFAFNVGTGAIAAGGANVIARRARAGIRGRTAFGKGIQRSALRTTGGAVLRKSIGARALTALGRGLNFVPHPAAKAAAGILVATVAGISAFEAASAAVEEGFEKASPGFAERNPGANFIISSAAGLTAPSLVKKIFTKLVERRTALSSFTGKPGEVIDLANLEKGIAKDSKSLGGFLEELELSGSKTLGKKVRAEESKLTGEFIDAGATEVNVLNTARTFVKGFKPGQPGGVKGVSTKPTSKTIPLAEGGGVFKQTFENTKQPVKAANDVISNATKLLGSGPAVARQLKAGPEAAKQLTKGTIQLPESSLTRAKLITPETEKALVAEVPEIRKVGKLKITKKKRVEPVELAKTGTATDIKSAGDLIENSSAALRERVKIMTDDLIPAATKVELNKTYSTLIGQGFSEGAAAKAVVDAGNKFKRLVNLKTASQKFEEDAAKEAKRAAKFKPKKKAEERFETNATDELDKILADEAGKIGKTIDTLSLKEFESIVKKSGKTLAILGTAIAAGALLPEDSEASVIKNLGKVALDATTKAESTALKNASKRLIQKKGESDVNFIERMLKDARAIPQGTINSAERRASTLTFDAKRAGLNLDKETARKSSVNLLDKTFGSVFNNFRKMGRTGEVLTNKFIQVDDFSEISAKAISKALKESLPVSSVTGGLRTNLTKQEGKVIHDLMTGATTKAQRDLAQSSIKIRSVLDDTFKFAEANGVPVVGYRQNYFPQIVKEGILDTDRGRAILINHLIKTKQVDTLDEAFNVGKNFIRDRFHNVFNEIPKKTGVKIAGRLEKSRQFDLPPELYVGGDGKNVLEALAVYSHQVTLRVGRIKAFGVNNERLEPVIKRLVRDGQDEQFIRNAVNVLMGTKPQSFKAGKGFNKAVGVSRAIEAIDLLGYAGPAQLAQITFTLAKTGPGSVLKGIKNVLFDQKTKEMVDSSAAVADTMSRYILEQFGAVTGVQKKATETALKLYGVLGIDRFGRTLAAAAGGEYAMTLAKRLAKSGITNTAESKLVQRQLRELDLSPTVMLRNMKAGKTAFTDGNLRVAMKRISDLTQFRSRPGDLPLWFSSDHAKLITQFKSFLFQSGSAINQLMVKEAKQGNFKPLAIALSVSPFVGSGVQEIRQTMKELTATAAGESTKDIGKFRDKEIKKGKFFTEPRDWMGGSSISRVWNDATYTLALGVLPDLITNLVEGKGLGKSVVGPNVDRVSRGVRAIFKDIDDGDFKNVNKELKRLTPLGLNQ